MLLSGTFGLTGCAAIEELKETFLRWVESEKPPSGRGVAANYLQDAPRVMTREKPPQKETSKPSKKRVKSARKPPQPQAAVLPPTKPSSPDSTEASTPEGTEGQSVPAPPALRWLPS